jgi:hypothetical protein
MIGHVRVHPAAELFLLSPHPGDHGFQGVCARLRLGHERSPLA